ncbi:MAG: SDR family oxidoreductase [Candidatus Caenarcaniphilales bacterium]|nr:SDR family oxidoreductase [Candidatus Caenarcaniphilales bacterium]
MINQKLKLAIITGSSKGIGRGIAEAFFEDQNKNSNWKIIGTSRSSNNELKQNSNFAEYLCDLMKENTWKDFLDFVENHEFYKNAQEICFVHNFGMTVNDTVERTNQEDWERIFYANVTIPFLMTKHFSAKMPSGSSHLYIGSTLSTMAVPNSCAYTSSKHALLGLMRCTAIDLASKGIRTNLICPGFTETEMADFVVQCSSGAAKMEQAKMKEIYKSYSPLKRFLTPKEVGDYVVFLANHETISGEILHINGGFGLVK